MCNRRVIGTRCFLYIQLHRDVNNFFAVSYHSRMIKLTHLSKESESERDVRQNTIKRKTVIDAVGRMKREGEKHHVQECNFNTA